MEECADLNAPGTFEARYLAFLETISHLRPRLHRYCARMTGSVADGEDVVQDALFQAYRKLETFDDRRPLAPWLFRIDGRITRISDYHHTPWVLQSATSVVVAEPS